MGYVQSSCNLFQRHADLHKNINKNKYLSENSLEHIHAVRKSYVFRRCLIRRVEPVKMVKIMHEKHCRTDDMCENYTRDDFWTPLWTWPHEIGHMWEAVVPHLPTRTLDLKGVAND